MSSTPQAKTRKVGRPRLDKYNRLINRLYEAMGVLFLKQKTQGPHLLSNRNDSSITAVRRRLQKNLGFILDWSKGGESTISIAIQDHSRAYIYWVAVNQSNSIKPINLETNILPFLRKVLTKLRDASRLEDSSSEQVAAIQKLCAKECCEYADKRLKKEQRILFNGIQRSLSHLKESDTNGISFSTAKAAELSLWLRRFASQSSKSQYQICKYAYQSRNDPQMGDLAVLGQETPGHPTDQSASPASVFNRVRHFIGRLAARIRIYKQLFEDAFRVKHLLDVFEVAPVDSLRCVAPPEVDNHTTIHGILTRMGKPEDARIGELKSALSFLEAHVSLENRIKDLFNQMQQKAPAIHSEIQILEHFHRNKFRFADNDRFVGTSKFSCLCCKLYFRHHPLRPVEPDSHEQIYMNWGPIALPDGSYDPLYVEQRDMLNLVIRDLRDMALQCLMENCTLQFNHPNSVTGLTQSAYIYEDGIPQYDVEVETCDDTTDDDPDEDGGAPL